MWICCLQIISLIATREKGASLSIALQQAARKTQDVVKGKTQSTVLRRVHGQAISWNMARRTCYNWKDCRPRWVCRALIPEKSRNWGCGSSAKPKTPTLRQYAPKRSKSLMILDEKLTDTDLHQHLWFFHRFLDHSVFATMLGMLQQTLAGVASRTAQQQHAQQQQTQAAENNAQPDLEALLEVYTLFSRSLCPACLSSS